MKSVLVTVMGLSQQGPLLRVEDRCKVDTLLPVALHERLRLVLVDYLPTQMVEKEFGLQEAVGTLPAMAPRESWPVERHCFCPQCPQVAYLELPALPSQEIAAGHMPGDVLHIILACCHCICAGHSALLCLNCLPGTTQALHMNPHQLVDLAVWTHEVA